MEENKRTLIIIAIIAAVLGLALAAVLVILLSTHNELKNVTNERDEMMELMIIEKDSLQREYEDYLLLDFSKASSDIKRNFEENIGDLTTFFRNLALLTRKDLPRGSLIIFDEVQLFPLARQAIKHLVKDGRYQYLETGSLISIKENVKDILIPSEEESLQMVPMDFEEFLWATGNTVTMPAIR